MGPAERGGGVGCGGQRGACLGRGRLGLEPEQERLKAQGPPRAHPGSALKFLGLGQQTRAIHKDPAVVSREPCV